MTVLKALVLALVLGNIGCFLWTRDIADTAVAPVVAPTSTIKLASEVPQRAHGAPVEASNPDSAAAAAPNDGPHDEQSASLLTNVKRCISIGPFRDVAEATRSATSLRARGYGPRQRVAEGEVWAGVWVYIPKPEGHEGVDLLLSTLKKAGVEDALEMPGPEESPVISLGLFSEPKRAQARVALVQGIGLQPVVVDRKRAGNVFWVDIDLKSTEGLLNPADLQGEIAPEANRIVRLEIKGCPGT